MNIKNEIKPATRYKVNDEELAGLAGYIASDKTQILSLCKEAMVSEADAITQYANGMNEAFLRALFAIYHSTGPLIVTGIGKSGHVARKIASTVSSIGRPSVFVHAAEASHGDLGVIQRDSVVLILSNSGETSELSDIIHYCRLHDITTISLTAKDTSTLARNTDYCIAYGEVHEVCPNGLAPTTSTTLSLAIGDALAVGLTHLFGTAPQDFRRYHPGGKLGAKLLRVEELMHSGSDLPLVDKNMPMAEVVVVMSEKSFGVVVVMDGESVLGIITDGDMRRNVTRLWNSAAGDIATIDPVVVERDDLAADAVKLMSKCGITACLILGSKRQPEGLLHIHDCLRAGVTQ